MDDGEATAPDGPIEPAPATSFDPPPMPASLPAPAMAAAASPATTPKRRFPWVTVIVGVIAVAAIVVLSLMFVSTSNDKDDVEQALTEAHSDLQAAESDLAESEAALKGSEAALASAQSDLSDTEAQLAEANTARADAEAAQAELQGTIDRHQQQVDAYTVASTDFLAASLMAGLGLARQDAKCVAEGVISSMGPEAMAQLAAAALDGTEPTDLDAVLRSEAADCGVSEDAFDDAFASDPFAYGDDPELDALYDRCSDGDGTACDDLYTASAPGSEYEQFAGTCGNRFEYSATEPCDGRV